MANMINTNIASLNAQNNLNKSQGALTTSLQRLSSGLRINSAKDDAAGMAIADRMTSQIKGTDQAARNANDGISLAQTAEGDLTTISDNLQRMRELAVQSANGSNSSSDRASIDNEVQALSTEIDRVAQNSSFNGNKLLDGNFSNQKFQIGANATANDSISVSVNSARTSALGAYNGISQTNLSIGVASNTAAAKTIVTEAGTTQLGLIKTDAKDLAAAINASGVQGLTATANEATVTGTTATTAAVKIGTSTFDLNGTTISVGTTASQTTNTANALSAINAQSASTGVVATDTGTGLKLTAADGRNIALGTFTPATGAGTNNAALADFGLAGTGVTTAGSINLSYVKPTGSAVQNVTISGVAAQAVGTTGTAISAINVLDQGSAQSAIKSIDAAISSVNTSRAALGVFQNRFASVVSNLQSTSENLTASRSRIQDTDFAKETASLTRGQILQQAGTAMLAQANSLPNGVLSLLR
jgi:flagellin